MTDKPAEHLSPGSQRITPFGIVLRAASFVIAWWAFTEGSWKEWGVGIVVIVAATLASMHILPLRSWRWSLKGLLLFIPFFLKQSFLGGLDVAWRALHPRMPIKTGLEDFNTRLPGELPRVFLAWTVSLLPGTASVRLVDDQLTVHVLFDENFEPRMREVEDRIAKIFGVLPPSDVTSDSTIVKTDVP